MTRRVPVPPGKRIPKGGYGGGSDRKTATTRTSAPMSRPADTGGDETRPRQGTDASRPAENDMQIMGAAIWPLLLNGE